MKNAVIGTCYVGLVTRACLTGVGNDVLCLDLDVRKFEGFNSGAMPIFESGRDEKVKRNVGVGRLVFATDIEASVDFSEIQFVVVGRPPDEDSSADLPHMLAAARDIGRHMQSFKLVENKSTGPVGTVERGKAAIGEELRKRKIDINYCVAPNPEFLKESVAVDDFNKPDRIVIGTDAEKAAQLLRSLYSPFHRNHDRLIFMNVHSAELTIYSANAMLAMRIPLVIELAVLAEKLGADTEHGRHALVLTCASTITSCTRGTAMAARVFPPMFWHRVVRRRSTTLRCAYLMRANRPMRCKKACR